MSQRKRDAQARFLGRAGNAGPPSTSVLAFGPLVVPGPAFRWFRWREQWSHGYSYWEFIELYVASEEEALEQLKEERVIRDNMRSEHWRGLDVEEILLPTREVLVDAAVAARRREALSAAAAERYEQAIRQLDAGTS